MKVLVFLGLVVLVTIVHGKLTKCVPKTHDECDDGVTSGEDCCPKGFGFMGSLDANVVSAGSDNTFTQSGHVCYCFDTKDEYCEHNPKGRVCTGLFGDFGDFGDFGGFGDK